MPDVITTQKRLTQITVALKAFLDAIKDLREPRGRFSFGEPERQQKVFLTAIALEAALVDPGLADLPQELQQTTNNIHLAFRMLTDAWGFRHFVIPKEHNKQDGGRKLRTIGVAVDEHGAWGLAEVSPGLAPYPLAERIDPAKPPIFGRLGGKGTLQPYTFGPDQVELVEMLASFVSSPRPPAEVNPESVGPPIDPRAPDEKDEPTTPERLSPGARALGAVIDLRKEGVPVSLKAACGRAGVDRANLRKNYPDAAEAIKAMSGSERAPRRRAKDRRTESIDAIDDAVDEADD